MAVIAILLCGGSGTRMGFDKLFTPLGGRTAALRSAQALREAGAERAVIVINEENRAAAEKTEWPMPVLFTAGGKERSDSVLNGLRACGAARDDIVLIHDAARCFMPAEAMLRSIESARTHGSGVCALPLRDSLVRCTDTSCVPVLRAGLWRTQTPQTFRFGEILAAYEEGAAGCTDDGAVYEKSFGRLALCEGSELGRKLTDPEDWAWALSLTEGPAPADITREYLTAAAGDTALRAGCGYDTHVLVEGRKLMLGGEEIPFEKGLLGHSDADVLLHAITDALLGAAALGDIGKHFPDKDPKYKNIDSRVLLREAVRLLGAAGWAVNSVDATVIAQRPKLNPHFAAMRKNIAADTGVSEDRISLKATTTERMNDEGRGLCISALAVATVMKC